MRIELVLWGIEFALGSMVVRLVAGDVFVRIPMVGQLAWNPIGFFVDSWRVAKDDCVLRT